MKQIKVIRENDLFNFARSYKVHVDGIHIGMIANKEQKTFQVSGVSNELSLSIDWCNSNTVVLEDNITHVIVEPNYSKFSKVILKLTLIVLILDLVFNIFFDVNWLALLLIPGLCVMFYSLVFNRNNFLKVSKLSR